MIIFEDRPMFSRIFKKYRRELSIDVVEHRSILKHERVERILIIFQDGPMFSHIIQKVSARELSIDVAENRCILTNNQNTHYNLIFSR